MTIPLRTPIRSKLDIDRLSQILESTRKRLEDGTINSMHEASAVVMTAFKNFFFSIGEPSTSYIPITPDEPPSSIKYNATMEAIQNDIAAAYDEVNSLEEAQVKEFNFTTTAMANLNNRLSEATSKVIDLNLINGLLREDVLVGGDDFFDISLIDLDASIATTQADILSSSGIVILKRTGSINVAINAKDIKVTPIKPEGAIVGPTIENKNRFYEGDFYDYASLARPEGDKWHLDTVVQESSLLDAIGDLSLNLRRRTSLTQFQEQLDNISSVPDPSEIQVLDLGATADEKAFVRNNMLDGNPSSFWECEYVVTLTEPLISKEDLFETIPPVLAGNIPNPVGNGPAGSRQRVVTPGRTVAKDVQIDPNQLRQKAIANDTEDLIVELLIELDAEQSVNFITLNPFNFGETAWLDVLSIELAGSDGRFTMLPGFGSGAHDNILTDEANEFINDIEAAETLAPNRFAYKGQGVWSFPIRRTKLVKMTIRQRTPLPNPYHRMSILMTRTLSKTKTSITGGGGM